MKMSEAELKYGDTGPMKKAIVAQRDIPIDKTIELEDLAYKRTEKSSYLEQGDILTLIGAKTKSTISKDDVIDYDNVEYNFKVAETTQFFNNK